MNVTVVEQIIYKRYKAMIVTLVDTDNRLSQKKSGALHNAPLLYQNESELENFTDPVHANFNGFAEYIQQAAAESAAVVVLKGLTHKDEQDDDCTNECQIFRSFRTFFFMADVHQFYILTEQ